MGDFLSSGITAILMLLPASPFAAILDQLTANGVIAELLAVVNWFVPIYSWVGILEGWLAAILVYYVIQVVLRWLNVIE